MQRTWHRLKFIFNFVTCVENMPWVVQWYGDGFDCCSGRSSVVNEDLMPEVEEKIRENRWFTIAPLYLHFPQISRSLLHKIVSEYQRSRYHLLCIAGGIILRWRDTNTVTTLWQVSQQWWKLCGKVVYCMYIKWQYVWFVIYSCFFLITHRNILSC